MLDYINASTANLIFFSGEVDIIEIVCIEEMNLSSDRQTNENIS